MSVSHRITLEMTAWRARVRQQLGSCEPILSTRPWLVLRDILVDWMIMLAACAGSMHFGAGAFLLSLIVIGNRQRALGNILHDAGHRNIRRRRAINDLIAMVLVAPALFSDLQTYRQTHAQHHAALGDTGSDPDLIKPGAPTTSAWRATYLQLLMQRRSWFSSLFGHLYSGISLSRGVWVVLWWCGLLMVMNAELGSAFTAYFVALWMLSRATVFHAITTFREMCDHFGLTPGGVFSFTRDIPARGPLRWLIHPRNNGFHLTHHLMPAIPYYHLPLAHQLFLRVKEFTEQGAVCDAYFFGTRAVTCRSIYSQVLL